MPTNFRHEITSQICLILSIIYVYSPLNFSVVFPLDNNMDIIKIIEPNY